MKFFGLIIFFILGYFNVEAQGYLDFVENKGQWDPSIYFKSDLQSSAFVLTKNGYRVLQHSIKDFEAIANSRHSGHQNSTVKKKSQVKPKFQGGDKNEELVLKSHVYEVKFLNANPNPTIIKEKPVGGISNYFIGNDPKKWATDVKTFQSVTYKNMYPNIDIRYYTNNGVLKYDIIVHPGGDPSKIILFYEGTNGLSLKNGALQIKTSVGLLLEKIPESYQVKDLGRSDVDCQYELKGNLVQFKIDKGFNPNHTLVIDPQVIFISYSGSKSENWGFTATYDKLGHFYAGGIVFGSEFPTTNGAYQENYQGGISGGHGNGYDIGISKFEPNGRTLVYATYIGGNGNEQPHSLIADDAGNLIIAGRTNSGNYPTIGSLRQFGPGGDYDIILTKISVDGKALIGSVKIGGKNNDGVNIVPNYEGGNNNQQSLSIRRNYGDDARSEVILDKNENILLASATQSTDFPLLNPFQSKHGSERTSNDKRMQDGVLIKMNKDLSGVIFSSFLGGNDDDAAFVLAINPKDDNIYVAGATASTDLPAKSNNNNATPGTPPNTINLIDGFVSIISSDGSKIINTRYFGTNLVDVIYGIQFDKNGFPYIAGTTTGNLTPINSPYNTSNQFPFQNSGKQFVAKLEPDLSQFIYRANFGSQISTNTTFPNISITAFMVDRCENIYISGWGGQAFSYQGVSSMNGMPLLENNDPNRPYQPNTDGQDFYFFVLGRNAEKLLYGSYYGQTGGFPDHVDGGTSRFDPNGTVYQTLCSCRRDNEITLPSVGTSDAYARIKLSANCNLLAIKFNMNVNQVYGGLKTTINGVPGATNGCAPLTVVFTDTLELATSYKWDFGDGTPEITTTSPTITHEFKTPGDYKVKMVAIDPNSCNGSDESFVSIKVAANKANLAFNNIKQLPCTSLTYEFVNTSNASSPFANDAFLWDFGDGSPTRVASLNDKITHTYAAAGTYKIRLTLLDNKFCNFIETKEEQINIAIDVKADFVIPNTTCVDKPVKFINTSAAGKNYLWQFDDGKSSTETSPEFTFNQPGIYKGKLIATNSATCNITDEKPFQIEILSNPTSAFTYKPNPTEPNTPVNFTNNSLSADKYVWKFGDGETFETTNINANVSHLYNATGIYKACLDAINTAAGCITTDCKDVDITINPGFNVPNA
ncbi:MAG: hypothetical protein RI983_770, partial [Bacteroidota bacterium]